MTAAIRNAHLDLTIRASNGSPWKTDHFREHDTVEEVIDKSLKHFIKEHVMQPGDYDLIVIIDGQARPPLHPTDRLADVGVHDCSVLALVTREPQVDG